MVVEHPSGARIEIPVDATGSPEDEKLMASVEEVEPPEGNTLPLGEVFDFSVVDEDGNDVHLREPVQITVPYTLPEEKDSADVALLHWDDRLGRWEAVEGGVVDESSQTVTAQVEDLSEFSISWYMNPIEFIAVAAFALVGATVLQADYDLGYKHLVSFHVDYGFRPPILPVFKIGKVGASLVFDLGRYGVADPRSGHSQGSGRTRPHHYGGRRRLRDVLAEPARLGIRGDRPAGRRWQRRHWRIQARNIHIQPLHRPLQGVGPQQGPPVRRQPDGGDGEPAGRGG